eukprot:CAMPEP_0196999296 /NCGR_PEP_ID=MMETSP1380-20130617/4523_1 /TAXON_ID=5936 /ORGANISM="Euplotes crassus, Strain CT5" /LENGTH=69 /DNA_ID=CAMNT_0042416185 /DNA_START=131 /DNA_END=340 /DNA_ORIENTATION=-
MTPMQRVINRDTNLSILNLTNDSDFLVPKITKMTTYKRKFNLPENFKPLEMKKIKSKKLNVSPKWAKRH